MDNRSTEYQRRQKVIDQIDKLYPSPEDRAKFVWSIIRSSPQLQDATDWDILCFCSQFIAMMSQSWLWLEKDARALNNLIYTAHYESRENDDDKSRSVTATRISDRGDQLINNDSRKESTTESERISDKSDGPRRLLESS